MDIRGDCPLPQTESNPPLAQEVIRITLFHSAAVTTANQAPPRQSLIRSVIHLHMQLNPTIAEQGS